MITRNSGNNFEIFCFKYKCNLIFFICCFYTISYVYMIIFNVINVSLILRLSDFEMEIAFEDSDLNETRRAISVEHCQCPANYEGRFSTDI